jgi:hypothetical protein
MKKVLNNIYNAISYALYEDKSIAPSSTSR